MTTLLKTARASSTILLMLVAFGCTTEFGTPCRFPESPEISQFCGSRQDEYGNDSFATCVDVLNPDCQTLVCVRFRGGEAFCSEHCTSDAACPQNSFCEFAAGSRTGICIPSDQR